MPTWAIAAAVIAVIGYFAIKKEEPVKDTSPKDRFDQGKIDGNKAALEDKKAGKPSRLAVTNEEIDSVLKSPESWMFDSEKSYALGFNIGYSETYGIPALSTKKLETKIIKKTDKKVKKKTEEVAQTNANQATNLEKEPEPEKEIEVEAELAPLESSTVAPLAITMDSSPDTSSMTLRRGGTSSALYSLGTTITEPPPPSDGGKSPTPSGRTPITLGNRLSPEWRNSVPYWYTHPSFRRMQ